MNEPSKIFKANYHVGSLRVYFDYIFDCYIDNPTLREYVEEHISGLERMFQIKEAIQYIYDKEPAYEDEINNLVNDRGLQ